MDLQTFLAQATPDEWHQVAWQWNWDSGVEPLRWIIGQPACDRGTALLIYWYGGPRYLSQYASREEVPDYSLEDYDLVMAIERAYLGGFYTRQEIAFDPADDAGFDWTAEYASEPLLRPIPAVMYAASPGRRLSRDPAFEDGVPYGSDETEGEG